MIKYYNNEDFNELTKNRVVIDFFANWCGPCKMLGKVMEEVEHDIDVDIIKIDTDKFPLLAREYKVMSIPTVLLFEDNKVIKENIGFMDENKFKDFVK
jgi:thioredoxin 1